MPKNAEIKRLLSRGGRSIGLAATAHASGQRAGQGPWYVLDPETVLAAEEVLAALEEVSDREAATLALRAALAPEPAVAVPRWAISFIDDRVAIDELGARVPDDLLTSLLGVAVRGATARERGLAAIATALAHKLESLDALVAKLDPADGAALARLGSLAAAVAEPGAPSRIRGQIKRFVKGGSPWDG